MEPLAILSDAERSHQLSKYLNFLKDRDGIADPVSRTLSKREAFFDELARKPVRAKKPIDRDAFLRNLRRKPEPGLDPKVTWLLAASKSNIGERYGVEQALKKQPSLGTASDETLRYIELEELVHTHLLLDCARVYGIEFELAEPPPLQRYIINVLVHAPRWLARPMTLAGEITGTVVFRILWERAADVFADEPEVAAHLRSLLDQILVDEYGHVVFNRAVIDPAGIKMTRWMLPIIARNLLKGSPEVVELAGGMDALLERVVAFGNEGTEVDVPAGLAFAV
ncbi:MAG TPA: hypothetical protein VK447_11195 [Myxococcaceae bacterium]|nr:hypothetical protein [Myxococcaceae bacterium]